MEKANKDYKSIIQSGVEKNAKKRKIINNIVTVILFGFVIIAIIPLVSILVDVFRNGFAAFNLNFLTLPPGSIGSSNGGIGPAIQGTFIIIGLASIIGVPIGILAGVYLSEYAPSSRYKKFAYFVRLFNDVMTGIPSVVVGIVGYITIVLTLGSFSILAGAFALSIIMIPIVTRVTEETLKLVPNSLRELAMHLEWLNGKLSGM